MKEWTVRRAALGCALSVMAVLTATAQDPQFTQFYANPLYLNPAFAGTARCPRVVMNYRNQWPALTGTFVTTSASYDQHVDGLNGWLGTPRYPRPGRKRHPEHHHGERDL